MRRHHTTNVNCAFVKVKRKKIGITMHVASRRAEITTKHWSNVENGRSRASIDVVVRMATALRCRPDELLTDTADMSINYLEMRMQETIQGYNQPDKKQGSEPLGIKEFLIIAKMLGYLDSNHKRPSVGYDPKPQKRADDMLLSQYQQLYQKALLKTGKDFDFLEFIQENSVKLSNLLSSKHQAQLETYLSERVMSALAITTK